MLRTIWLWYDLCVTISRNGVVVPSVVCGTNSDVCRIFNEAVALPVNGQLTKIMKLLQIRVSFFYHSSNYY